jgi:hypothetical protein
MRDFSRLLFLTILLLSSLLGSLHAEIRCSPADYRGTYAFFTSGAFVQLPPQAAILQGPFAQSGTFTPDGQGNITIESTASYNGIIQPANVPATYTLTPECVLTVSGNLPDPLGVPFTFVGVLSLSNRQLNLTITSPPGTVVIGEHLKQDTRFCGLADFEGAYQIDLGGSVTSPASRAGRFQRVGRLVADGDGQFTAVTIANYAGQPAVEEDFQGTYSVNARCLVTLSYTFNGENITVSGALAGHGEQALMMVASPGWAVSGYLRAQQ